MVQEERQRPKSERMGSGGGDEDGNENSNLGPGDMPAERILEAERMSDKFELDQAGVGADTDIQTKFKFAGEKQLNSLVEWAKHIPHFAELNIDDQVINISQFTNPCLLILLNSLNIFYYIFKKYFLFL